VKGSWRRSDLSEISLVRLQEDRFVDRESLSFEIILALAFKALALCIIYFAFFGGTHKASVTASDMAAFLTDNRSPR
jgi:hypothetical protein